MKSAHLAQLRQHSQGLITDDAAAREGQSGAGLLEHAPAAVAYPSIQTDVQQLVRLAAQEGVAITARGYGHDPSGAAAADGLAVALSTHLNQLVRLSKDSITIQAGMGVATLQQILKSHDRELPPLSSLTGGAVGVATIGGLLAAGTASGSPAHGDLANWMKRARVVLDDGSIAELGRLSRWELNRKKGRVSREGDIYRAIDGLLQDHGALVRQSQPDAIANAAGYRLEAVKRRDGSVNLSRLLSGAQGSLGIIVELTFRVIPAPSRRTLLVANLEDLNILPSLIAQLHGLRPSRLEAFDAAAAELARAQLPELTARLLPDKLPELTLLVEFDSSSHLRQNRQGRRAERLLAQSGCAVTRVLSQADQEYWWSLYAQLPAALRVQSTPRPLPLANTATVPIERLPELATGLRQLLAKYRLDSPLWGAVGVGNLQAWPRIDLTKAKGRRQALKFSEAAAALALELGGSPAGMNADGRLLAPYLERLYGAEMYQILQEVKRIWDPANVFNPGVKFGVTKKSLEAQLRRHN